MYEWKKENLFLRELSRKSGADKLSPFLHARAAIKTQDSLYFARLQKCLIIIAELSRAKRARRAAWVRK